jgi:hypothetical protein
MTTRTHLQLEGNPMEEIVIEPGYEYDTTVDVRGRVVLLWIDDGAIVQERAMSSEVATTIAQALRCGRTDLPYRQARPLAADLALMADRARNMKRTPPAAAAVYERLSIIDATSSRYQHPNEDDGSYWIQFGTLAIHDLATKLGWPASQVVNAVEILLDSGLARLLGIAGDAEVRIRLASPGA